jgi:precorrin-3B methylase
MSYMYIFCIEVLVGSPLEIEFFYVSFSDILLYVGTSGEG